MCAFTFGKRVKIPDCVKDMVLRMTVQREEPVIATILDRAGSVLSLETLGQPLQKKKKCEGYPWPPWQSELMAVSKPSG